VRERINDKRGLRKIVVRSM